MAAGTSVLLTACLLLGLVEPLRQWPSGDEATVRFATFNCSLNRNTSGELVSDLTGGKSEQAWNVARILRTVRPDVVLLNEFDHDVPHAGIATFQREYLEAADSAGTQPIRYPFRFVPDVNSGEPSGCDFNRNGSTADPEDAFGFGRFPGQYGLVVLSRFPIDSGSVRTFQKLHWSVMPGAVMPIDPTSGKPWYDEKAQKVFRLSSKNHCDIPVVMDDSTIRVLVAHPTPPAFDGEEDRNGRRNHDEIGFWSDYLTPDRSDWIVDDSGNAGGLSLDEEFVILGDLNADPFDGDSYLNGVRQILDHERVSVDTIPTSQGAVLAAENQRGKNEIHRGPHAQDTSDFNDSSVGNLRVDYVLPSVGLRVDGSGVFWPTAGELGSNWIDCSDHRLVWVDLQRP